MLKEMKCLLLKDFGCGKDGRLQLVTSPSCG